MTKIEYDEKLEENLTNLVGRMKTEIYRSQPSSLILYAYAGCISDEEADWISAYAKNKGLEIYAIGGIQKCADGFISCSPFEVLAYFKNAGEVITDMFHGSFFSIITHRKFASLVRKSTTGTYGNEEKLTNLLSCLHLKE